MPTLGANLNHLLRLENRLITSADRIERRTDQIARRIETMIRVCDSRAAAAHRQLNYRTERIMADVDHVRNLVDLADWRGGNQARFEDAYYSFHRTMSSTTRMADYYFENVEQQVSKMTADLDSYKIELRRTMADAQQSTMQMANQVELQHERLDQAMNGGFRATNTGAGR